MSNKNAFVLMPFAEEFMDVYRYLIADGLKIAGYNVKRADDIKSQNNIIGDIVEGIVSSDLIVADLTGANPNVYYELGIAHALNKKVILLTQEIDELPFDLRSYRVVSYSVHFAKMNQAKEELSQLATDAFKGNLPFGNPVKDFGWMTQRNQERPNMQSNALNEDQDDDLGLLDYRVKLEEGFEKLGAIVTNVGARLEEITPEITKSGEKLTSGKYSSKEQRNIVRELANYLQEFGAFVKPNNEDYKGLLKDIESSLEYLLSGNVEVEGGAEKELQEFIDILSGVEQSAFDGRQGFVSLVETMDALPKIEKSFNRAKVFMSAELKEFVSNIDQTISVIARAGRLGKILIEKTHKNQVNKDASH